MEHPIRLASPQKDIGGRAISAATAVAIEVAVIFGLIGALNQGALIRQIQEIQTVIYPSKEIPKAPPPPPTDMAKPVPPVAIIPMFTVQSPPPAVITTVPKQAVISPPVVNAPASHAPANDPLRPIARTHILPPYPQISRRLNEQGTTLMEVAISTQGDVSACSIVSSSSSA